MKKLISSDIKAIYRPPLSSHKGQNGRLLMIGGSKLFHASSFWAADIASRIVDLVHFSSPAEENNQIVRRRSKEKFWNGIVVSWKRVEEYIEEDDCIVIGPGMPRKEGLEEGEQETGKIVNRLLRKYSQKRWVVDGGALQEMDPELLNENMIVTPHSGEFNRLFGIKSSQQAVRKQSEKYGCVILLKGVKDVVCSPQACVEVEGGNEGMTKGGTGDVLAGLIGALYCKNRAFMAAKAGSLINKSAGDRLYRRVGPYFNASDLVREIPYVLKELVERK